MVNPSTLLNRLASHPVARLFARQAHWLVLALGLLLCAVFMAKMTAGYELWFDELLTLFYADPAAPLGRLIDDIHPPLHYTFVRVLLSLSLSPQAALWLVNAAAVGGGLVAVWVFMRRAGHGAFAIAAAGMVLMTPGLLRYLLEGRDYAMAQGACLAMAGAALARLDAGPFARDRLLLGGLGALCGGVHLFAGIFAGAIGGSLTLIGLIRRDRGLVETGLITGAAASIITLAWSFYVLPLATSEHVFVSWVANEQQNATVPVHLFALATFIAGKLGNLILLVAGVALCGASPAARRHVLLLALTVALFVGLPVLASLVKPMITGRYLGIASPALVLMAAFIGWRAAFSIPRPRLALVGAGLIALFGVVLAVLGPSRTAETMAGRKPYAVNRVSELLQAKPVQMLRVKAPDLPPWGVTSLEQLYVSNFRFALHRSDIAFDSSLQPPRDVAGLPSGLAGWSEDNADGASVNPMPTTPEQALAELNLTNTTGRKVSFEKTTNGFLLILD